MRLAALLGLVPLLTSHAVAQTRSRWCDYAARSLNEVMVHAHLGDSSDIAMSGGQFPSRVAVRYTGQSRPVTPDLQQFLATYVKTLNYRAGADTLFRRELRFAQAADSSYWFLIQEVTFSQFRSEVQAGDTLTAFLLWAGSYLGPNRQRHYVFIVNEFSSPSSRSYWQAQLGSCRS